MSTVSNNKKYLNLEGVRVSYRPKEDTIQITSVDEDLTGESFLLTLKKGTPSEDTLRNLLKEKGIIKNAPTQTGLPSFAPYPTKASGSWNEILLGVDANGDNVVWDITTSPNALITGMAGAGKSVFQRNLFLHCITHSDDWKILGVDTKRLEIHGWTKYKENVLGVAGNLEEAVEVLKYANKVMEDRYVQISELPSSKGTNFRDLQNSNGNPPPAIMVIVDEAYSLMAMESYPTPSEAIRDDIHAEATNLITRIAMLGRAAGVFVVLSTQRPDVSVINEQLKSNLTLRVVVGRTDATPSEMVLGSAVGTTISGGSGRCIASNVISKTSENNFTEFQTYYAAPDWVDIYLKGGNRG